MFIAGNHEAYCNCSSEVDLDFFSGTYRCCKMPFRLKSLNHASTHKFHSWATDIMRPLVLTSDTSIKKMHDIFKRS